MQVRCVDAVTVRKLKQRAVKDIHQNCMESRVRGMAVKEALEAMGLWEEDDKDAEAEDTSTCG